MADMDAAYKRVHPKISAWKTAGGDYIVLSNEPNTAGGAIVVRHMPQATWQTHYAADVPAVYAPALKGNDAAFAEAVQKRIDGRHGGVKVEPIADFALSQTDSKDSVYADYVLRQTPLSLQMAQKDAREVLVFMVEEMMALGINPGKEDIMVSLSLFEREKGLTGKDMVRSYGRWRYTPATDSAEWLAPGK